MAIVGIAVTYIMMLLVTGWPFALLLVGILYLLRKRTAFTRTAVFVPLATLFFTPAWGPATIAIVPVPFGVIFGISAITLDWGGLIYAINLAPSPYWYFIAFPATAIVAYGLWRFVLSNYSFQRTSTRDAGVRR